MSAKSESESESDNLNIIPTIGACAVFTIDPLASLHPETREDPEVIAACKKLVNKQYVGFIGDRLDFYMPSEPYNACIFEFVLQGLPKAVPDRYIDPSMSVPIAPTTIADHPSSRIPLNPSNPLPWNDCYLSPFWGVRVRSPSLVTEAPIDCILDLAELGKHDRFVGDDLERQRLLVAAAAAVEIAENATSSVLDDRPPDVGPIVQESTPETNPQLEHVTSNIASSTCGHSSIHPSFVESESGSQSAKSASLKTADSDDVDEETQSLNDAFVYILSNRQASKQMITGNFSHDLSTVKELNDPAEYFKEVEALARIEEEAFARIAIARELAIKAAADQDAELYDGRTLDMLVARADARAAPVVTAPAGVAPVVPRLSRVSRLVSKIKSGERALFAVSWVCFALGAHPPSRCNYNVSYGQPEVIRELAQKPHKPHAAFWHCAKPHAEIRPEVTEKPSQWRGSWVERQVLLSEKIALLPQLLCAGREKCAKSEWSRSDGWTNCFPSSHIDQIVIWMNTIQYHRDLRV
ncbi:hypothetical protein DFH09DRAFT_1288938 [Mycena vulgaris]|nr:hypothetical protein DFH09DRAFT_1288938 [Mycena vulgaris]